MREGAYNECGGREVRMRRKKGMSLSDEGGARQEEQKSGGDGGGEGTEERKRRGVITGASTKLLCKGPQEADRGWTAYTMYLNPFRNSNLDVNMLLSGD